jgi:hypothetical protein
LSHLEEWRYIEIHEKIYRHTSCTFGKMETLSKDGDVSGEIQIHMEEWRYSRMSD